MPSPTADTLAADRAAVELNDRVRALREAFGLSETVAMLVSAELTAWAGNGYKSALVIPAREIREASYEAVLQDFTGRNHAEVMRKHRISLATLYRVLAR